MHFTGILLLVRTTFLKHEWEPERAKSRGKEEVSTRKLQIDLAHVTLSLARCSMPPLAWLASFHLTFVWASSVDLLVLLLVGIYMQTQTGQVPSRLNFVISGRP